MSISYKGEPVDHRVVVVGRIRRYMKNPQKLLPPSCALLVWKNDVFEHIETIAKYLGTGAGVKVVLDHFEPSDPTPNPVWSFYIDDKHPDYKNITEHQRAQLWPHHPAHTYTRRVIRVADSMTEDMMIGGINYVSIIKSWKQFIELIRCGDPVVVDLSQLRPAGINNGRGLISTGPLGRIDGMAEDEIGTDSFLSIYEYLAKYLATGDLVGLLNLLGQLTKVIKRGGLHPTGIITHSMRWTHPNFNEYLDVPMSELTGSQKKAVRLVEPEKLIRKPKVLRRIVDAVNFQSAFLEKMHPHGEYLYSNVCVTADTWVMTTEGPKQVGDLVGVPFVAVVDGKPYPSTSRGFWSNGQKETVKVSTVEGYELTATQNHRVLTDNGWKEAGELTVGDRVVLNDHRDAPEWKGHGNFDQGWLLGYLIGNGSLCGENDRTHAKFPVWGEHRDSMMSEIITRLEKNCQLTSDVNGRTYSFASERSDFLHTGRTVPFKAVSSRGAGRLAVDFGVERTNKTITEKIETASFDFYRGFIQGLFDADAHVAIGQKNGCGKAIQFTSVKRDLVIGVQRMLLRLGIASRIYHRPSKGVQQFPDGEYDTRDAYRLDITGRHHIRRYASLIGFSKPDKQSAVEKLLSTYKKSAYKVKFFATVSSVTTDRVDEVFDCTIQDVHAFDANGLYVHNCEGIMLPDRGSCLLTYANMGRCETPMDLTAAYAAATRFGCELYTSWRDEVGPEAASIYLPSDEDRQIGVGWMALANYLALHKISYADFIDALEAIAYNTPVDELDVNDDAYEAASAIELGYIEAAMIARDYGIERFATIEPNQRCWVDEENNDLDDYTACRNIDPPYAQFEQRDSDVFGARWYDHGLVETMPEVSHDDRQRLWEAFQIIADRATGGMIHTQSFDLTKKIDVAWLVDFIVRSPLLTTYYQSESKVDQSFLNKGELPDEDEDEDTAILKQQLCSITNDRCEVCGE